MDKTVLITGSAQRLGAEQARHFHAAGYRVIIHYHTSAKAAHSLADTLNTARAESALVVQGNLAETETAAAIVRDIEQRCGSLDVLVNNASIYEASDCDTADIAQWTRLLDTNLRSPYLLSTCALPLLRARRGAIINLTDIYGKRPQAGHAIYCVSKAGLIGLTRALARDLAPDVRVNGVSPGPIIWAASDKPAYREDVLRKTPLGRLGEASDIAAAVKYLAEAPYVTGQILEVDGGRSIFV